jgi:hypothetical protein
MRKSHLLLGILAVVALVAALVLIFRREPHVGTLSSEHSPLPPEAKLALEQGTAAVNMKDWAVAVSYFNQAHRAAPSAPQPLYYLGLAEAQIPGRELRAICWLEAYLALAPQDVNAGKVRAIINSELEVKARQNVYKVMDLLGAFADKMDFERFRTDEQEEIDSIQRKLDDLQPMHSSPQSSSVPIARWAAQRWVRLVEDRMDIPAFVDFERTLSAAADGHQESHRYPPDPYEPLPRLVLAPRTSGEPTPEPTEGQLNWFHTSWYVSDLGWDVLFGLADIRNQREILSRFETSIAGVPIQLILGAWPCTGEFAEGMVAVSDRSDQFHHHSCTGVSKFIDVDEKLVPGWFASDSESDELPWFSEGLVYNPGFDREGHGYFDKTGTKVLDLNSDWEWAGPFSEGLAYVRARSNSKYGFIDLTGRIVIPLEWDGIGSYFRPIDRHWVVGFSEGQAAVSRGGKWGFIDKTGKVTIQPQWDHADGFTDGRATVVLNGKLGFIDKTGALVIPLLDWEDTRPFCDGLARVARGDKEGFINKSGQIVIPLEWDHVGSFSEGLAWVGRDGNYGFVDRTGRLVIPLIWNDATDFLRGIAIVSEDVAKSSTDQSNPAAARPLRSRLIDKTGKVITLDNFPEISRRSGQMVVVKTDLTFRGQLYKNAAEVLIAVAQ